MKMMWAQLDFFLRNICNFVFSEEKKSNSQSFAHIGFCSLKVLTKIWDLAADIGYDT